MIIKAPCGAMEGIEIQGIHQFLGIAENWATLRLSSMYRDLLF